MGLGAWYGETGLMLTTQFFALKIQRYMHQHGISPSTLAKVAVKAFENGSQNPNAWRRTPMTEEQVAGSTMVSDPLTQFMFCSPGEGAVALVLCRADGRPPLHRARRCSSTPCRSPPATTAPSRCSARRWPPSAPTARPSIAARAAFEQAGIGPGDIDVAQIQDTESGAEIMHMAETGLCKDGEQEQLIQSGATAHRRLDADQHRRRLHRQRRADRRVRAAPGLRERPPAARRGRRPPGARRARRSRFTHVYGAPGVSACTVMTR